MKYQRTMGPGPALDKLIAWKVFGSEEIKPYSTCDDHAAELCSDIGRHGYEIDFREDEVIFCDLKRDSTVSYSAWGHTYEEAIARAALLLYGSNPE